MLNCQIVRSEKFEILNPNIYILNNIEGPRKAGTQILISNVQNDLFRIFYFGHLNLLRI